MTINQYNGRELGKASAANQFMNFINGLHTHLLIEPIARLASSLSGLHPPFYSFFPALGPSFGGDENQSW